MNVKARSSQALLLVAVALVAVISIAAVAVGATSDDAVSSASSAIAIEPSASSLTDIEVEGIMFMREEEKLAYDVYVTFADMYGQPIFSNIAAAETQHMAAVLGLIEAYELDDPVDDSPVGVFANQDLQSLYDELIAQGSVDLAAALEVGAVIEEVDIVDLQDYLDVTSNPDIIQVYENLLRGSENHLRSFVSQLEASGAKRAAATHMDQAEYEAILSSEMQRGGGSGAGHGEGECDESGEGQHEHDQGQGGGMHGQGGQGQGGGMHGQGGQGQGQGMHGQNG
ncbi:MAG: DUF2202 domain-containing protein [Actinomycetota bacterium]|nr:DUF2202 domain-containing protein [Actinomycetota bacterium]